MKVELNIRLVLQLSIVLGLTFATVFLAQAEESVVYTIDPTRSELVVQLFKTGVGAALAHDHVVLGNDSLGKVPDSTARFSWGNLYSSLRRPHTLAPTAWQ